MKYLQARSETEFREIVKVLSSAGLEVCAQAGADPVVGGQPAPHAVLYQGPDPDNTGKRCGKCMMWGRDNRCTIHDEDLEVTATMVCGYYVHGNPMDKRMTHEGMTPVTPQLSGLEEVGEEGTYCGDCQHYEPVSEKQGRCYAVDAKGEPALVAHFGCCSAWVRG